MSSHSGEDTHRGTRPPSVSVILPVRDRADVVGQAVASVLNQTYGDLELIVIDDGSTDGTLRVIHAIADPRLKIIEAGDSCGVSAARNLGIERARGRYLAFQDSDDIWTSTKLERQLAALRQAQDEISPLVGVSCCRGRIEGTSILEGPPEGPGPFDALDLLTGALRERTPLLLVDRSVIDDSARFDPDMPAVVERDYLLSALSGGTLLVGFDEVLVTIRRGRSDHVAQPRRASAAYRLYLTKYRAVLEQHPDIAAWYQFQAMRESLRARDRREAISLLRPALEGTGWRTLPHAAAGLIAGGKGLSGANRLLPVKPPPPRRAQSSL